MLISVSVGTYYQYFPDCLVKQWHLKNDSQMLINVLLLRTIPSVDAL